MDILLLVVGFAGLVLGGEFLVRGAVLLARHLGISPMVIGLTLVGFGTSTPELVTSLQAALAGSPGIAVGNVVGSNTANILLIVGLSALIAPIAVHRVSFLRDGTFLALATLACLAIVLTGHIDRLAGTMLIVGLGSYLVTTLYLDRSAIAPVDADLPALGQTSVWRAVAQFVFGLALTIVAARFLVFAAINIAADFGVSEAVIGVTIVAIGTSMPELITSVVAARRQQADIAIGNILGSNLFNILGILGLTAIVQPMDVPQQILQFDIWVMGIATAVLIAAAWTGWRISRREGFAFFVTYGLYLGWLAYSVA